MHFKPKYLFIAILSLLLSCEENRSTGLVIDDVPASVEDLHAQIQNISFIGELPSGQIIDFSPRETFSKLNGNEYSSLEAVNYSEINDVFEFDVTNNFYSGEFRFLYEEFETEFEVLFQYAYISTYGELAKEYPDDIFIDEEFNDWVIAIAIGSSEFDIDDVLQGEVIGVSDYLVVYGPPTGDLFGNYFAIGTNNEQYLSLDGVYTASEINLQSSGETFLWVDMVDFTIVENIGPYTLLLQE